MTRMASVHGSCIALWESRRSQRGLCCIASGSECRYSAKDSAVQHVQRWETAGTAALPWKWTKALLAANCAICTVIAARSGPLNLVTQAEQQARLLCSECSTVKHAKSEPRLCQT